MAGFQVDNTEATGSKTNVSLEIIALIIRASVNDAVIHPF